MLIDATEQRVSRPGDDAAQRRRSSGTNEHTLKTQIVTAGNHRILASSAAGVEALADKGDQALVAQVEAVVRCDVASRAERDGPRLAAQTPRKKPRGGELTDEQRRFNRGLGRVRIRVELCLGGLEHSRPQLLHPDPCVLGDLVNAQTALASGRRRLFGVDSLGPTGGPRMP